jgi:DNA (cytosine-5)-methyltransferase 1
MNEASSELRSGWLFPDTPRGLTQSAEKRKIATARRPKNNHAVHEPSTPAEDRNAHSVKPKYSVVSMFSGCGGMDLGFHGGFTLFGREYDLLPFEVIWANEHNPAACRTYRRNLGVEIKCEDVWTALSSIPDRADVLIGGFPCQDVSVNGKRKGVNGKRTGLYKAMIEGIKRAKPKVFVAENVKGLLMKDDGASIRQVVSDFEELGYKVSYKLHDAANFGVPQIRERVIIIGVSDKTRNFVHPSPVLTKDSWVTAKAALADLEVHAESPEFNHTWSRANKSGEQGNRKLLADRPGYTIRAECHGNIQYHYSLKRRISMREAARIQSFPDTFIFDAKLRETERQVGNAVPPVLAWHVARAVEKYLGENEAYRD